MQRGPRRTTRQGGGETESFINARFQIIHLAKMLHRDSPSPRIEFVDFSSELFKLILIP